MRVVVNGASASVIRASSEQVDFVCPRFGPRNTAGDLRGSSWPGFQRSARGDAEDGPGIVLGGWLWRRFRHGPPSRGLAALPRFDRAGMPAFAGDTVTLFATGINCNENPGDLRPLLYFGHTYQQITSLQPSSFAGVCEIQAVVPGGLTGNEVTLVLEAVREDGTPIRSNQILMAIED